MAKYVKVLSTSGTAIDAIENPTYITWNSDYETVEVCEDTALNIMGIVSSSTTMIWQINGKEQFPSYLGLVSVNCEEIDQQEYEDTVARLRLNGQDVYGDPIPSSATQFEIQRLKTKKENDMSNTCSDVITNGVDVKLSDGNTYHFSLTIEDQLNLITISSMIAEGQTILPYHADGEPCVYFSAEDMTSVIETATAFKTFHTTYFNSLKTYISALETAEEIESIYYGIEIPEEYKSPVWKEISTNENT